MCASTDISLEITRYTLLPLYISKSAPVELFLQPRNTRGKKPFCSNVFDQHICTEHHFSYRTTATKCVIIN